MVVDPHWDNVVYLNHFDGSNGATESPDVSKSTHTVTFNGTSQISTAQSLFGGSSLLLNGGTSDFVESPFSTDWQFGSGEFTVELSIRWINATEDAWMIGQHNSPNLSWGIFHWNSANKLNDSLSSNGTTSSAASPVWNPVADQWYVICMERDSSGIVRLYVDGGFLGTSRSFPTLFSGTEILTVGTIAGSTSTSNAYIDEVRITKGVARYASDSGYTVDTEAFPEGPLRRIRSAISSL